MRAQAGVRRALAERARHWGLDANDLAFLPLAELRRNASPPRDAAARAAAARAELARLARFAPPHEIQNGRAVFRPPARGLRGRGTGGRVRGRVRIVDPFAPAVVAGEVAVVATVIPPMAPLLAGAVAIVAEHGGLLGHGAALARELGIPCIVGCVGALTTLRDGDEVWLDADAGVVVPLGPLA
jgi:pyruvate,water dikinase